MHITKKKRDAIIKLHRQGESIELLTAISRTINADLPSGAPRAGSQSIRCAEPDQRL